jgi:putative hydrolase of the HAD superfamily
MKTIIFDMYGVIIKESKGNFIPYTFSHFDVSEHERIIHLLRDEKLFTKAGNGDIGSYDFLQMLGYKDPVYTMHDYIENYLTIDNEFYDFAERNMKKYNYALLSNDVSEWSKYITEYYNLNKYFKVKIISADVHHRKPDVDIYDIILQELHINANDCIFIDNSTTNLNVARNIGMDTILFNRDNVEYDGKVVYSFQELSNIIKYE